MRGGTSQRGGDPALAALLASLFSGGIAAYGYKQESQKEKTSAADSLEGEYGVKLRDAATKDTENAALKLKLETSQAVLKRLETERNDLAKKLGDLAKAQDAAAAPALAFKAASSKTLTAAIDGVIAALGTSYPHLVDTPEKKAEITKVLTYPTNYQAKLEGLTLPVFYEKRVKPVLEGIAAQKGGRRRRRRRQQDGAGPYSDKSYRNTGTGAAQPLLPSRPASYGTADQPAAANQSDGPLSETAVPTEAQTQEAAALLAEADAVAAAPTPGPVTMQDELARFEEGAISGAQPTTVPAAAPGVLYPATEFPLYPEFAALYAEAIQNVVVPTPAAAEAARSKAARAVVDTKAQSKKDTIATGAAAASAGKLTKALDVAEKEINTLEEIVTSLSPDRQAPIRDARATLDTTLNEAKSKVAALYGATTEAAWLALKEPAADILTTLPKQVSAYADIVKAAKKGVATTTIHTALLAEVPPFLKKIPGLLAEIKTMKKGIVDGMKSLPMPEQYRGGCAVRVLADEFEDILNKLAPLIERRQGGLKKAFEEYTKETKGQPIYDSSIKRDDAALAESKAAIDRAVKDLNAGIETFFASVERMKGGALEKVNRLMDDIELGRYALRLYTANIIGLKDSYTKLLTVIDRVEERRLETPAEWEEEKKSCPDQIKTLRNELKLPSQGVPIELGEEETTFTNPMFSPTLPSTAAASGATTPSAGPSEPGSVTASPALGATAAPEEKSLPSGTGFTPGLFSLPATGSKPVSAAPAPGDQAPKEVLFTDLLKSRTASARDLQKQVEDKGFRRIKSARGSLASALAKKPWLSGGTRRTRRKVRKSTLKTRRGGK